jgi:hypothetical protein
MEIKILHKSMEVLISFSKVCSLDTVLLRNLNFYHLQVHSKLLSTVHLSPNFLTFKEP